MKISVLASGSKGNCTFVENEGTRILIDLGMSCKYVEKKLDELGINPNSIDAVLITHIHTDHIVGLKRFYKKYKPIIYSTKKTICWLEKELNEVKCNLYNEKETIINNLLVSIVKTSHDVDDSVGFLINNKLVYITDTGYLNEKYFPLLTNKEMYIFESNHDIETLQEGSYPYYLKQRILSDTGHLSNKDASYYLSKLIGDKTQSIVLVHLSEENNTPDKALNTLKTYIKDNSVEKIIIATQDERTELINI